MQVTETGAPRQISTAVRPGSVSPCQRRQASQFRSPWRAIPRDGAASNASKLRGFPLPGRSTAPAGRLPRDRSDTTCSSGGRDRSHTCLPQSTTGKRPAGAPPRGKTHLPKGKGGGRKQEETDSGPVPDPKTEEEEKQQHGRLPGLVGVVHRTSLRCHSPVERQVVRCHPAAVPAGSGLSHGGRSGRKQRLQDPPHGGHIPWGTATPRPGRMVSGTPPTEKPTTGVPQAEASRQTVGKLSCRLHKTRTSAAE